MLFNIFVGEYTIKLSFLKMSTTIIIANTIIILFYLKNCSITKTKSVLQYEYYEK